MLNVGKSEEVNVNICGFNGVKRSKYTGCEDITREEVVKAMDKLKNGKAAGIDDVSAEMLKCGSDCGKFVKKRLNVVR